MKNDVFLTGATGLIGGEIAWRLMKSGRRVWCLVRSASFAHAAARVERRLALSAQACDWSKLVALPGDVTTKYLGLDPKTLKHLQKECGSVIHCAADTSFAVPNNCQRVNVDGTRNVLKVCAFLEPRTRLLHLSSAFVCTSPRGRVVHEHFARRGVSNDYVSSKRNSERVVLQSSVNAVVLRPSIVLSHGLRDRAFARSILWVLPVIRELGVLPLTGDELLDIVGAGFVAESVAALLDSPLPHRIYHVSAGLERSTTLRQLFAALTMNRMDYAGIQFAPDLDWSLFANRDPRRRRLKELFNHYRPFLRADIVYDRKRLEAALGQRVPSCPPPPAYCAELVSSFTEREGFEEAIRP